jgi:hypothetical protein
MAKVITLCVGHIRTRFYQVRRQRKPIQEPIIRTRFYQVRRQREPIQEPIIRTRFYQVRGQQEPIQEPIIRTRFYQEHNVYYLDCILKVQVICMFSLI